MRKDATLDASTLEAVMAPGVALHNVADRLPRGRHRRKTRRPPGQAIDAVFLHHSGALGRDGVRGAVDSARYVIKNRGFPCAPYHFWAPRTELRDAKNRLVLLRLVPNETRSWHTGGRANDRGVGIALQGNTSKLPVSWAQVELLEAFYPWISEELGLPWSHIESWLGWHSIARRWGARKSKPACPGVDGERWVRGYLGRAQRAA